MSTVTTKVQHRILVVDDASPIHEDFRKILGPRQANEDMSALEASLFGEAAKPGVLDLNFRLDGALQGQEALELVRRAVTHGDPYTMAFVDMRMPPGWDGLRTIEELWKVDPALEVVICTAYSDYAWEEIVDRLGQTDQLLILKKPFDPAEVCQVALALSRKQELARQAAVRTGELEALVRERTAGLQAAMDQLEESKLELELHNRILARLYQGSAAATGEEFFGESVRHLSAALGKRWVIVGELQADGVTYIPLGATQNGDTMAVTPFVLHDETLCTITRHNPVVVEQGAAARYTREPVVNAMAPESLMVLPLESAQGKRLGVLLVMHDRPLRLPPSLEKVVHIFADRVAAELRRRHLERERQRMEHALFREQKLESLGLMAGGIAHDFNNLLCGVLGNAALLLREVPEASPLGQKARDILASARTAAELSHQLLACSGKGATVLGPVDLNQLVARFQQHLLRQFTPNITFDLQLAPDLPPVKADEGQVKQVLLNLAINAKEAMEGRDGATVLVRTRLLEVGTGEELWPDGQNPLPGRYVALEVRDTGEGIAPENLVKVFEPFFSTKFTGRGLGLSAVMGIVRGHGGAIHAANHPEGGAVLTVCLPVMHGACAQTVEPIEVVQASRNGPPREATLLVVDDEPAVRDVVEKMLLADGYGVVMARCGEDALKVLEERGGGIDLVLLDRVMPGLTGEQTLEAIQQRWPQLPVVFISGYHPDDALEQADTTTVYGYLLKPIDPDDLTRTVQAALGT